MKKNKKKMATKAYTQEQMEELAQNRDNIVMQYKDTNKTQHAFANTFIKEQVLAMRKTFEEYLTDYKRYTEDEVRNKVLNSKEAHENSWRMLFETQPKIFGPALKRFATEKDKETYDTLLKILELECLREKGLIRTEEQIENYWRSVGLFKDMCPVKWALENSKKK